jgi:hypothetical protein
MYSPKSNFTSASAAVLAERVGSLVAVVVTETGVNDDTVVDDEAAKAIATKAVKVELVNFIIDGNFLNIFRLFDSKMKRECFEGR